jgi:hypothetical protein
VISHPRRADYDKAQLRAPDQQKGEFLKLFPGLPLGLLPPPLSIDRCIEQAPGALLGHLSIPVRLCKLTIEKATLQTRPSTSSRVEASVTVLSTSTFDTLSHASLSTRVALSSTSLMKVLTFSHTAAASWAEFSTVEAKASGNEKTRRKLEALR